MKIRDEFIECPTCYAKPGSPTLCVECIERRELFAERAALKASVNGQALTIDFLMEQDHLALERMVRMLSRALAELPPESSRRIMADLGSPPSYPPVRGP
jgi:hypothetical protein